ncbi:ras-related protein Rab-34 isoform X2 [Toxorhynchites rutilus septentrionalis]|uniref:ras-related protein Rab-34 isoform X2 n=1 Tax=Toxorhynchites rutilus septentrionalis TaxID=329112 RepID=UPI002479DE37|nr:ras-related protein Rab-34 isoform X2 [Toxorhynchites rutilus septentrionalis]
MSICRKSSKKACNYEVLNNNVDYGTRRIDQMPLPYCDQQGPYRERVQFSERTQRTCKSMTSFYLCACKVIFVGDVSTGKSSLVNRFCRESFDARYPGTIGVDFEVERFYVLNHAFSLQIFKCIAQGYYRNTNVIVTVFDMSRPETLMNARRWLDEAMKLNSEQNVQKFLVGTKMDLLDESTMMETQIEATRVAEEMKAEYWPVSSQTGENVTKLFQRVAALAFDAAVQRSMEPNHPVIHPSGNSLLNLYFLRKEEKIKQRKIRSFCRIN